MILDEVARLRVHTRHSWGSTWFALLCFGTVTTIAAGALVALGSVGLMATWILAGSAALLLTRRHYRSRGRQAGVTGRGGWTWRWSLALFVLCFVAAALGSRAQGRDGGVVTSIVVVVAAYVALGCWRRRSDDALKVVAAATPALAAAALSAAPWIVELSFGAGLIMAGAVLRARAGER